MKKKTITLERAYLPDRSATIGILTLPCGWNCYILERPWLCNSQNISCIPEGLYVLTQRSSAIVDRTTKGAHKIGWEVTQVTQRSHIMIHPGNWAKDSEGCLLPGNSISYTPNGGVMVANSVATFNQLMEKLSVADDWLLQITTKSGGEIYAE